MKCPTREELDYYFYGESENTAEIKKHADSCDNCNQALTRLTVESREIERIMKNIPIPPARQITLQDIKKSQPKSRLLPVAIGLAACLVAFILLFLFQNRPIQKEFIGSVDGKQIMAGQVVSSEFQSLKVVMDGKEVKLRSSSTVTFINKENIELQKGAVTVDIQKKSDFEVKTQLGTATAKGTKFETSLNGIMKVTVFSGIVEISNSAGSIQINPDETGIIEGQNAPRKIKIPSMQDVKNLIVRLNDPDINKQREALINLENYILEEAITKQVLKIRLTTLKEVIIQTTDKAIRESLSIVLAVIFKQMLDNITDKKVKEGIVFAIDELTKGSWDKFTSPLKARYHHSCVNWEVSIVIFGGLDENNNPLKDGAIYNLEDEEWTMIKENPFGTRESYCSALFKDKLIIWGGSRNGTASNDGEIYDLINNEWQSIPKAPIEKRINPTAVISNAKMFIFGGSNPDLSQMFNDGAIFDIEKQTWTRIENCPLNGRSSHYMLTIGDKIFIFGGKGPNGKIFNDGAIYDITKNEWKQIKKCPLEKRLNSCAVHLPTVDKILIWGGIGTSDNYSNDGAIYNISDDSWTKTSKSPLEPRANFNANHYYNAIVIWGGEDKKQALNNGAIYDFERDNWKPLEKSNIESRNEHSAVRYGNKVVIWGGRNISGKCFNDGAILELPIIWDR